MKDILSKKDYVELLGLAYKTLSCDSRDSLKEYVLQFQNLIYFEYSLCAYVNIKNVSVDNKFPAEIINVSYPDGLIKTYLSKGQHLRDYVTQDFFQTFEIQNCSEVEKRHPIESWKDVIDTAREFRIRDGFVFGTQDYNFKTGTIISFLGSYAENNERTKKIIKYGVPFFSAAIKRLLDPPIKEKRYSLTKRETEVLKWLKEGKTSWEISQILNVAESTINFHIRNILKKLNSINRIQAVSVAIENKLIDF